MRIIFVIVLLTGKMAAFSQNAALKTGHRFPDLVIRNILNAPVKKLDVHTENNKLLILNFWGTWCAPCIPEMDHLAELQKHNPAIQVIGISDETPDRLQKYLQQKPSALWLASDTSGYLYQQFGFNSVGQAAVINKKGVIVALVMTDSINQVFIDKLKNGEPVTSSAQTGNKMANTEDVFQVDSLVQYQVTLGSYRPGVTSMGRTYRKSIFENRRLSFINVCASMLYREAFNIQSHSQVEYVPDEKSICDFSDKSTLWCFDLVVKPESKDSLYIIMQQTLNKLLPVKGRLEKREKPVYVLKQIPGSAYTWKESQAGESTYSFSGEGFSGTAVTFNKFSNYVSNELGLPVIDETGLTGRYDIKTGNVLRSKDNILQALEKLGLTVEKTNREMDVLVVYKETR